MKRSAALASIALVCMACSSGTSAPEKPGPTPTASGAVTLQLAKLGAVDKPIKADAFVVQMNRDSRARLNSSLGPLRKERPESVDGKQLARSQCVVAEVLPEQGLRLGCPAGCRPIFDGRSFRCQCVLPERPERTTTSSCSLTLGTPQNPRLSCAGRCSNNSDSCRLRYTSIIERNPSTGLFTIQAAFVCRCALP